MNKAMLSQLTDLHGLTICENEPMSKHSTFKIGGPAKLFIEATTTDALISASRILSIFEQSPLFLGNGSNMLFSDSGFDGVILKNSSSSITISENTISADAGALLPVVSASAMKNSLSGLEFAQGIPGSVGGALVMNAGAYGGEVAQVLTKSTYLSNGEIHSLNKDEHSFSYRSSFYKKHPECLILSAEFELTTGDSSEIANKMRDFATRRREKQPLEYPSAGSVFKRPEGHFAGALIEQCGLKGKRIGGASVSKKHAGFIINDGGATADDVKKLICFIQETVLKEAGVSLECEICIL